MGILNSFVFKKSKPFEVFTISSVVVVYTVVVVDIVVAGVVVVIAVVGSKTWLS